MMNQFMKQT